MMGNREISREVTGVVEMVRGRMRIYFEGWSLEDLGIGRK